MSNDAVISASLHLSMSDGKAGVCGGYLCVCVVMLGGGYSVDKNQSSMGKEGKMRQKYEERRKRILSMGEDEEERLTEE